MDQGNYVEVQEEIVTPDTTYMCGACYEWFPHIEDFNVHNCSAAAAEGNVTQETNFQETCTMVQDEGDLEKDVANILGEMKYSIPSRTVHPPAVDLTKVEEGLVQDQSYVINYEVEPTESHGVSNLVEQKVNYNVESVDVVPEEHVVESVEIPSSCLFPYENPVYLNRLMKDNTVGKRVRHDAPYTHRLGPWDDTSTKLLIRFIKEVPAAVFIASDNVKRTEAWELIRNKLSEADHHFTVLQIRMRWRELCKKYRNVVNCNEVHGGERSCQFFAELNDLFGIWNKEATEILIKELTGKNIKQNGGLRMRFNTWDKIRKVLSGRGYHYTAHQIHGRWNALVTLYQRMVERNANPNNEQLEMAYKDLIEPMFPYTSLKKEKASPVRSKEKRTKWSAHLERALLHAYSDNIENFRKSESKNNREIWSTIVETLKNECNFTTTVEKARTRFYELAKYYSTMLRYNSQAGALHRESRHHELLAKIYNRYNFWPHDGSIIKMDNSNARRMRQLNAQLRWSEEESRAVLQLYPQVLTEHLQSVEQQPLEELWVEMSKMLMCVKNISKLPYEIEEQIVLLRRGFKSDNPFPFRAEMEELEETEHSLCFSPEESPSTDTVQLIPYWSQMAACTLLDYVIHYRQEGVKTLNDSMYEVISMDLESHGYSYTSRECRQYYLLLKKMFKNKIQSGGEEQDEAQCGFPYWNRMMELRNVSHYDFEDWRSSLADNSEIRLKILEAASSKLEVIEDGADMTRQQNMERNLTQLKVYLMSGGLVRPPPPIKIIARTLLKFMKNEEVVTTIDTNIYFAKLRTLLHPHLDMLSLVADRGALRNLEKLQMEGKKRLLSKGCKIRAVAVNWNDENIQSMLTTIKEWRQLCHDEAELESILCKGQPLWDEVAYNLSRRVKKDPDLCKEYFDMLCYKFIREELRAYQGCPESEDQRDSPFSVKNKNTLSVILSPLVAHDAEWDSRDVWWAADADGWSCEETLELLFTVRELLSEDNGVDWDQVRMIMYAGGYERPSDIFQSKFINLYNGYKRAYVFNKECIVRARRRPPYYFKIHTLFGFKDSIRRCYMGPWQTQPVDQEVEEEVFECLMAAFKEKKNMFCHMVPRIPLLNNLATHLDDQYRNRGLEFSPNQIWNLLVQLHSAQADSVSAVSQGPFGRDLDGLWQNHPNPLVAYGLQAIPTSGWQWVKNWSVEELTILLDRVIEQCLPESLRSKDTLKIPNIFLYQLGYMLSTFKHGGYEAFEKQLSLIYMLQKWSHVVLEERNSILQKVRENYRKIEESKAILRSVFNGKCAGRTLIDDNELTNSSEESDERDIFSDSEVDGDLEATDSDEESHETVVNFKNKSKTVLTTKPCGKYIVSNTSQKSNNTTDGSVAKKGSISQNTSDFKYVFRVTTTPHLKIGVRTMKHAVGNHPSVESSSAKELSVMSPLKVNKERCVQVSVMKKSADGSPNKRRIDFGNLMGSGKRKLVDEDESQVKKLKTSESNTAQGDSVADQCITPSKKAEEHLPRTGAQTAILGAGSRNSPSKKARNTAKRDHSLSKEADDEEHEEVDLTLTDDVTVRVNESQSPEVAERNKRLQSTPKVHQSHRKAASTEKTKRAGSDGRVKKLKEEESEEGKEALKELTSQYYERRKQEKDRLITAFNSVQESHQKQASALLLMFDKLQKLL